MPLCNMRDLLNDARKGSYAVGSFSVANLECVMGVVAAAEELRAPIILQCAEVRLKHTPLSMLGPLMIGLVGGLPMLLLAAWICVRDWRAQGNI